MLATIVFVVSGILVCVILLAKMWEIKTNHRPFILRLISLGDSGLREVSYKGAGHYSNYKDKFGMFLTKQLPLQIRNLYNKASVATKTFTDKCLEVLREKGIIAKKEGISEFLKNIEEEQSSLDSNKKVE